MTFYIYHFVASHLSTKPNASAIVLAKSENEARKVLVNEGFDEKIFKLERFGVDQVDTSKLIGMFE